MGRAESSTSARTRSGERDFFASTIFLSALRGLRLIPAAFLGGASFWREDVPFGERTFLWRPLFHRVYFIRNPIVTSKTLNDAVSARAVSARAASFAARERVRMIPDAWRTPRGITVCWTNAQKKRNMWGKQSAKCSSNEFNPWASARASALLVFCNDFPEICRSTMH